MSKSRLSQHKQGRLLEHFVAGTTARCAASLAKVNFKTSSSSKAKPLGRLRRGYVHIDIAEVRTTEGKLYLFVDLHDRQTKAITADFLHNLKRPKPLSLVLK